MPVRLLIASAAVAACAFLAPARAQDTAAEAYAEMEERFGFVPGFMKEYPQSGIVGAWILTRDMEMARDTALSPKVKALINIAVAAQIPCRYCVYLDTLTARSEGATDEEIREAVAQAGLTRHWSTVLNGMQVDFDAFRAEFAE
ncbi:carboxymuconolactone decarboxylase family protein [Oceanicella sp. SM1341]|uniref:carboxymuconolactone decarboxylase family protein n=1 Tax=Oceanicella sp. SM1341 TaxID=1548889 RepID=UPI000E4E4027|nr:carboxymuconolactone decarboxylase family protein [Oceanicella sp. SM1341]